MQRRASGILLHPTSLPGDYGVGDLGPEAYRFVDALAAAGVSVWQMLPVTAPGAFDSPYDCRSAFAGNWLLISPEQLIADGFLPARAPEQTASISSPGARADLTAARESKDRLLRASWEYFRRGAGKRDRVDLESFPLAPERRFWLDDWALYSALSSHLGSPAWDRWPDELRRRDPVALRQARHDLADELEYQRYLQFLFYRQFASLREHASRRRVRLCGDLPMYVSHQSADVWARPEIFELDDRGRPLAVAGVPPDAFSATGQLWGNPVYCWRRHRETGFEWWIERVRTQASLTDLLRLDHFRAFLAYFEVPAGAPDARSGRWVRGPGHRLFDALHAELGELKLIAEDLGRITPAVHRLRRRLGLPGMKVLQFGFGDVDSDHLPHHFTADSVAYTGTHDNNTLVGWFETLDNNARQRLLDYLGLRPPVGAGEVSWQLIHLAMQSVAELAVVPLQDVLGLGDEGRMNTPGTAYDNWRWRMAGGALDDTLTERLRRLVTLTGRLGGQGGSWESQGSQEGEEK